jgi:nucleoside-diphosphate kinase
MERSCVLIKPDGIGLRAVGRIIDRLEQEGFLLLAVSLRRPDPQRMTEFYGEHAGKVFFPGLMAFVSSGPLIAMVWSGDDVVARIRQIVGATDPKQASSGTLRARWGTNQRQNLVHASDSPESAEREIEIMFRGEDLSPYDADAWQKPMTA